MGIQMIFDDPIYISCDSLDTLKIEFNNMDLFLIPKQDGSLINLADGFTITLKIPPQSNDILTQEEKESTVSTAKTSVLAEILVGSVFLKNIMQTLLGSIIIFQILAHLPLADILLPANSL